MFGNLYCRYNREIQVKKIMSGKNFVVMPSHNLQSLVINLSIYVKQKQLRVMDRQYHTLINDITDKTNCNNNTIYVLKSVDSY